VNLVAVDGRELRRDETLECDVVVVGSGPGGAPVARDLATAGADVVVLEEGPWLRAHDFTGDSLDALSTLYRDAGLATTTGPSPMPLLQGRVLGGTSVVNSAICWRLPRGVYEEWIADDPTLAEVLEWDAIEAAVTGLETTLGVGPTEPGVASGSDRLMARGADALGLGHRPTRRNVRGCRGSARCNRGCPAGAKLSMDTSLLPEAVVHGARIVTDARVERVTIGRGSATGVTARASGGARVSVRARDAVVLSAGATNTPALLLASGARHGPVGRRFQAHPGVAVAGLFAEPVNQWHGATQGHEITGLMDDGIKIETLALDPSLTAARLGSVGTALAKDVARLPHCITWAGAVRAEGMGRVARGRRGPRVTMPLTTRDLRRVRRTVQVIGEAMFAAGATAVAPGVAGFPSRVSDVAVMSRLGVDGPLDQRAYSLAISHMFGTCKLGTDPETSVIRGDFRHHAVDSLYVSDASVFPTNLGVNPQLSIMSLARCCATAIAKR
jgi:choline dehydrogenase-like flavoprotein